MLPNKANILRCAIWDTEHTDFTEHADVYLRAPYGLCLKVMAELFHAPWARGRRTNNCFSKA
jgi:hypothetical protein